MLPPSSLRLLPSRAVRDELEQLARADPRIAQLARPQPDDPVEPEVIFAAEGAKRGTYPMVEVPVSNLPGRLFVGRMPGRHGDLVGELEAIRSFGMAHVVCMIPEADLADHELYDSPTYLALARTSFGAGFHLLEVVDYEAPGSDADFDAIVEQVDTSLVRGERVLLHCGAGCGRTGVLASCLMVAVGMDPLDAVRTYRRRRGCGPETSSQVAYVVRYARRRAAG